LQDEEGSRRDGQQLTTCGRRAPPTDKQCRHLARILSRMTRDVRPRVYTSATRCRRVRLRVVPDSRRGVKAFARARAEAGTGFEAGGFGSLEGA
jgi:hypothetical protein